MSKELTWLSQENLAFPAPNQALTDPNGLLALGGNLSVGTLYKAYENGIFPWYCEEQPIMWWSPDPRAVIYLDNLKINRTLRKFINKHPYQVTFNTAFSEVIDLCADAPFRNDDTWIIDDMRNAYIDLHEAGFAHSVEVWHDDVLVGGLYGVAIGGFFSGESMFYTAPNASKVALISLAKKLKQCGALFIDCQIMNPFLESMGATEISREQFIIEMKQQQSLGIDRLFG